MSVSELVNGFPLNWNLEEDFNITGDVTIDDDLTIKGKLYNNGIAVVIPTQDNTWTGTNNFVNFLPECAVPSTNPELSSQGYVSGLGVAGNGLLSTNNNWTGSNKMDQLPLIGTGSGQDGLSKTDADPKLAQYRTDCFASDYTLKNQINFVNCKSTVDPTGDKQLCRKAWVDSEISGYTPNVEIVEFTATGTLTQAQQSGVSLLQVIVISGGGNGFAGGSGVNYGGSGNFACFNLPVLDKDITFTFTGTQIEMAWDGTTYFVNPNGEDNPDGTTAPSSSVPSFQNLTLKGGFQLASGTTPPKNSDTTTTQKYAPVPCVFGNAGRGGSYNSSGAVSNPPDSGLVSIALYK